MVVGLALGRPRKHCFGDRIGRGNFGMNAAAGGAAGDAVAAYPRGLRSVGWAEQLGMRPVWRLVLYTAVVQQMDRVGWPDRCFGWETERRHLRRRPAVRMASTCCSGGSGIAEWAIEGRRDWLESCIGSKAGAGRAGRNGRASRASDCWWAPKMVLLSFSLPG